MRSVYIAKNLELEIHPKQQWTIGINIYNGVYEFAVSILCFSFYFRKKK
jgi:hypothetical protein